MVQMQFSSAVPKRDLFYENHNKIFAKRVDSKRNLDVLTFVVCIKHQLPCSEFDAEV